MTGKDQDVRMKMTIFGFDCYDAGEKSLGGSLKVVGLEDVRRLAGKRFHVPNFWSQCLIPWRTKVLDCPLMRQ